ncbi:polyphosphate kinase 1 [Fimbriimonas ginsengisoli]|uniref:Polyphosphate kinase n=1 Tax=Fimbriimonas ginsengisoli Gsoil 348 TaxID=661478 RepID=A0A068NW01_FIMGI|nr:polyphosphate kinase 1 [Fimbriimonas ginsengisoli]AIE87703.1 polyphosphate kinase [Fimbriimonas ginsengisoli Gsoil 348]
MRPTEEKSTRYLNRELSWLEFNRRVLEEAVNPANPLLERVRFLAIFESNLDEFYMVRVSGLIEQFESGVLEVSPDGLTPTEQLLAISRGAGPLRRRAANVYLEQLQPQFDRHGIAIRTYAELTDKQREELHEYFHREVFPLCTPLILHPAPSVPFISNRSLNLAVEVSDGASDVRLARVKVPDGTPRLVRLSKRKFEFVLLEEIIANNLQSLFPGVEILGAHLFRVIRDADVEIRQLEAADLIAVIEETLRLRRFGDPVLLQHQPTLPDHVRKTLMTLLRLDDEDVFSVDGPLGLESFHELTKIDKPSLRFPPHLPYVAEPLANFKTLFETIAATDVLVHHPYDAFRPVEEFVASADKDSAVVGVKQTLYRVGSESPIVESLLDAAEEGKQVAAMVELKARFDESNNLVWARALERAGVHVTYGFQEMKTHCKLCLVVRREKDGMRQYAHIGTGNYNPSTARLYTDLGLFTCDPALTQDISELFNYLTGFSKQTHYRKLLVAPLNLREGILDRIRREAKLKREGRIFLKLNALVDPEVIEALYDASAAGVKIDLIVRGTCCIRPGVVGMSETVRVVSIVGRFLEHSRVYYFENGGKPDVLIGSADCMRRNLDRRIEVLAPVESRPLIDLIRERILTPCLQDNVRAWELDSSGHYHRIVPKKREPRFDSQAWFMEHPATKEQFGRV